MESEAVSIHENLEKREDEKLYTLTRGELSKFDETSLKRLQELLMERKKGDMESMIASAKLSLNFGGDFHSIYFRTNKSITLNSLGFWGPFEKKTADYNVKIVISEYLSKFPTISTLDEVILDRVETFAKSDMKQIFIVTLTKQILLQRHKWIRIRFQLNGPDTCICSGVKSAYSCIDSKVDFEFFDSSHQLPVINFTLS